MTSPLTVGRWLYLYLPLVVLLAAAPHAAGLGRYEAVEPHMGTLVRIVVYAADVDAARRAHRAGFDRIRALEQRLSDYRPDSELNGLTGAAANTPVAVSADLFAVLSIAQNLAQQTAGAFDVTQGPVIRLWREARRAGAPPDPSALASASALTGFTRLRLDEATRTVTLSADHMALDLGGIGKGYAASEAIAAIRHAGVSRALVAVSGDVACGDAPPGQVGWRIGVHSGEAGVRPVEYVTLTHAAMSTSGPSAQYLEIDGRRYSHIIDPTTRAGLTEAMTVSVIAPHGGVADGLATAVSVVGVQRGLALVESWDGAAALVIERSGSSTFEHRTSRFPPAPASNPES